MDEKKNFNPLDVFEENKRVFVAGIILCGNGATFLWTVKVSQEKACTMIGVSIAKNFTTESRNNCCSKLTNKGLEKGLALFSARVLVDLVVKPFACITLRYGHQKRRRDHVITIINKTAWLQIWCKNNYFKLKNLYDMGKSHIIPTKIKSSSYKVESIHLL